MLFPLAVKGLIGTMVIIFKISAKDVVFLKLCCSHRKKHTIKYDDKFTCCAAAKIEHTHLQSQYLISHKLAELLGPVLVRSVGYRAHDLTRNWIIWLRGL